MSISSRLAVAIVGLLAVALFENCGSGGSSTTTSTSSCTAGITINKPATGASSFSGAICDPTSSVDQIAIYVLTNEWYLQTTFSSSGDAAWSANNIPNTWASIVAVVYPASYSAPATNFLNPGLDPQGKYWTEYQSDPLGQSTLSFSGYTWGIKETATANSTDEFGPGPNYWSTEASVVSVQSGALNLHIQKVNGLWQCGEVYLTKSLGYGTYTVQVGSPLNALNINTVASPTFLYVGANQEFDSEFSGPGGLVPTPHNSQFVVQPYTAPGNIMYYNLPSTSQFTVQMVWQANSIIFTAWNGWAASSTPGTLIYAWTYTGSYIPPVGQDRVHISLWLDNGNAPTSGTGDSMVINSFTFN
jgi:hypothetical protein